MGMITKYVIYWSGWTFCDIVYAFWRQKIDSWWSGELRSKALGERGCTCYTGK